MTCDTLRFTRRKNGTGGAGERVVERRQLQSCGRVRHRIGFVLLAAVMFIKLWFWLEMHTNRVLRELHRVELLPLRRLPAVQPKDVTAGQ